MPAQVKPVSGRVVAVTGGARGIGRATAAALAARGARVAIGDVDAELAERAAREIAGGTVGMALDVTERASFAAFLDAVEEQLGPLDVLVNNAGIMPMGAFEAEQDATARAMVDVNLHGVLLGSKLALARMRPRGSGHLVNVASAAGKFGAPGVATYCATKHAVVGLCEALRLELRRTGIELSCVMPGVVNTELTTGVGGYRFLTAIEPEDVAAQIVSALERPRFEVFVPRALGVALALGRVLPRRLRDALVRAAGGDTFATPLDAGARAGYDVRTRQAESRSDARREREGV